jgi:hypothetical protein
MAKKISNFGIKALIALYDTKLLMKGSKLPFVMTLIIIVFFVCFGRLDKEIISSVVDLVLSIIPSLLGFVLSGYALLIGFGNIEIIAKRKSNDLDNRNPTLYQKVSTVFAVSLIMQILLLVYAFGLKIILKTNLPCLFDNFLICGLINYVLFILLIFGSFYVIVMIKDLVINIFNFSQIQHFTINKPRKENKGQ